MAKKSPFSSKTEEYPERCEAKADGLLLDFCRFIRLQAAQDAWLRRLTRQHTMAFLGRGFFLFRVIFFCACVLGSISGVFRCFWDVFWDIIFGCLLECLFVFFGDGVGLKKVWYLSGWSCMASSNAQINIFALNICDWPWQYQPYAIDLVFSQAPKNQK